MAVQAEYPCVLPERARSTILLSREKEKCIYKTIAVLFRLTPDVTCGGSPPWEKDLEFFATLSKTISSFIDWSDIHFLHLQFSFLDSSIFLLLIPPGPNVNR